MQDATEKGIFLKSSSIQNVDHEYQLRKGWMQMQAVSLSYQITKNE